MPRHSTRALSTRKRCEQSETAARNIQNSVANELRTPTAPAAPVIAGELLTREELTFLEFLFEPECDAFCKLLFARENTCVGTMLGEFRKATKFHYFGHRRAALGKKRQPINPGLLTAANSATKKLLKDFVRVAYRGDPHRRGILFWKRIAWILWNSYAALMLLRRRAAKARNQELERINRQNEKRQKRAEYMRGYRAKTSNTGRSQVDAGP